VSFFTYLLALPLPNVEPNLESAQQASVHDVQTTTPSTTSETPDEAVSAPVLGVGDVGGGQTEEDNRTNVDLVGVNCTEVRTAELYYLIIYIMFT